MNKISEFIKGLYEPRYELTDETLEYKGRTLHRIRALKNFTIKEEKEEEDYKREEEIGIRRDVEEVEIATKLKNIHYIDIVVKKGDLGGWVESEDNLSQKGNCWIAGQAKVYGNARVQDGAWVYGEAEIYENALVSGNARVCGKAKVFGNSVVTGNAIVCNNAWVFGNSRIYINAWVFGNARIYGNAEIYSRALVYGEARVFDNAKVCDWAEVFDNAVVCGDAWVCEGTKFSGKAWENTTLIDEPKTTYII